MLRLHCGVAPDQFTQSPIALVDHPIGASLVEDPRRSPRRRDRGARGGRLRRPSRALFSLLEGEFLLGDHGLIRKQIGCKNDKLFIIYQFQVFYGASESSIDVVSGC